MPVPRVVKCATLGISPVESALLRRRMATIVQFEASRQYTEIYRLTHDNIIKCVNCSQVNLQAMLSKWHIAHSIPHRNRHRRKRCKIFLPVVTHQQETPHYLSSLPSVQLVQLTHLFAFSLIYFLQNLHLTCLLTILSPLLLLYTMAMTQSAMAIAINRTILSRKWPYARTTAPSSTACWGVL